MNLKNFTKCGLVFMLVVSLIACQSINSIYALTSDSSINVINKLEGDGLEDSPYLITSLEDYNELADAVIAGDSFAGKTIKLTADIGSQENPVTKALGTYTNVFGGNLDGDGHTIYLNLTADRGLINKTENNTTIKNITIEGSVNYTGTDSYVGGLAGVVNSDNYIENCINRATINGKVSGGLIGYSYGSIIKDCKNYGYVQGEVKFDYTATAGNGVGGIVGTTDGKNPSTITGCINYGNITSNNQAGGIVGKIRFNENTVIENCVNGSETISPIVNTTATDEGGLAGGITSYSANSITNCVNYGTINTSSKTGSAGIVAYFAGPELVDCINYGNVSGTADYTTATTDGYGVGGIAGTLENTNASVISGCKNFGAISSNNNAGGIVGKARTNADTSIANCINYGTVIVTDSATSHGVVGGITGMAGCNVSDCANRGIVNGTYQVGGIVGALLKGGEVNACLNVGQVVGLNDYVGGIVGFAYKDVTTGSVTNCIQQRDGVTKADTNPTALVGSSSNYSGWITGRQNIANITTVSGDNACKKVDILGSGTEDDPYLIQDEIDYDLVADNVISGSNNYNDKYLKITADLGSANSPITKALGTYNNAFSGNLDGDNHTVYINLTSDRGLMNKANNNVTIKNLVIDGSVNFSGSNSFVGGLAGLVYSGSVIENIINKATINGNYAGGVIGYVYGSTIRNCSNYGTVNGAAAYSKDTNSGYGVGGIVGTIDAANPSSIINCSNFGTVTSNNQAGGIVGKARANAETTISNCINNGTITVTDNTSNNGVAGGIAGMAGVNILSSTNDGTINGTSQVGGIVGAFIYGGTTVDACHNFGSVNASKSIVGGIVGYSYNAVDDGSIINCVQHFDNVKKASASPTDLVYPSSSNYSGWILGRGTKADVVISGDDACTKVDLYGYGTETNPFTISNLTDWNNFANNVTNDGYDFAGTFVELEENIGDNLNPVTTIVGNNDNRFAGTFDGLNHTIYLNINLNSGVDTGAFSGVAGIVKNLVIDGSIFNQTNNSRVGGVVGRIVSGHIENCVNKANILGNYYVGGIVGLSDVEPSYILNCSNYGDISGAKFVGGITGYYQAIGDQINTYTVKEYINSDEYNEVLYDCTEKYASIINCVNYGTIMADGEAYVGGIAGVITKTTNASTDSGSTVIGCLNYGEVQGTNNVAGIVGWAYKNTPEAGVDYCYNFTPDIKIGEAVASKIKVAVSTTVSDSHLAYIACFSETDDIGSNVNNFVNYEISINSASATIAADGSLILNVYSIPKNNIDTETAYVKVNDVSTLVKDLEVDDKGRFVVSTPDLEPVYMNNDFSIQYFDANNNPLSREVTMSIQDYLMNFYNGSDAGLKSLAKSMLNYGSYCQLLFNINTDSLANSTLVETDKDVSSVVANIDDIKTNGGQTEGVTPLGFSLVLNNKTDLKLYLNIDGDVNEYKAYIDDEEVELVRDSGSRYFVRINNVAAPKLNEKHNITLTHNETGDLYINCSLLSYAYSVINKAETTYANNQNLVNAMRAMYAYHNSAKDLLN